MRHTFKILFYIKRNALLRNGDAPIMCRITINGHRVQLSTHISVSPDHWSTAFGRATGRTLTATTVNDELEKMTTRLRACYDKLRYTSLSVSPMQVKDMYCGYDLADEYFMAFFRRHNEEFAKMVGINRSKTTLYKYRSVLVHIQKYITNEYHVEDLPFRALDRNFLIGFHRYLSCICNKKNTVWVYLIALKHILSQAREEGFLTSDLFVNYKLRSEFVMRDCLSQHDIQTLMRIQLESATMRLVRDAFVFSCFTGLSDVDVCALTPHHIYKQDGRWWIVTTRQKTGTEVSVMLFDVSRDIVVNYMGADVRSPIFSLPSNGWCNKCLQNIAEYANIQRSVTFHTARHTFATTITLSQGLPIETISLLLGHKSVRTTQIYASVTHSKLGNDLQKLSTFIDSNYKTVAR